MAESTLTLSDALAALELLRRDLDNAHMILRGYRRENQELQERVKELEKALAQPSAVTINPAVQPDVD